jgi:hypothetical protein
MASIISGSIDLTKIDKSKIFEGKKGKYYPVTVVINNELGQYGDSGYIQTEQSKEERDAKQPKTFLGNVKVVWTDGQNVSTATKEGIQTSNAEALQDATKTEEPDLPF